MPCKRSLFRDGNGSSNRRLTQNDRRTVKAIKRLLVAERNLAGHKELLERRLREGGGDKVLEKRLQEASDTLR